MIKRKNLNPSWMKVCQLRSLTLYLKITKYSVIRNPWQVHFKNQEVRKIIRLDVDRTFQKQEFFRLSSTKSVLENILFVWSMSHDLGYRQGMNEIVGVIIFYGLSEKETIDGLISHEHIEADSYWIFDKIMDLGLSDMYLSGDNYKFKNDSFAEIPTLDRSFEEEISVSIRKCHYIFHRILSRVDNELFFHIHRHKFEPQLFLLRWIRCLLCREFSLANIGEIWDVIFCFAGNNKENFIDVLNYFCISMLVNYRNELLSKTGSELLQTLMKPISVINNTIVIKQAVEYFNSKPDKSLAYIQTEKEEAGLLQKVLNFVTEKIAPTHEKNQSSINSESSVKAHSNQLQSALENIDKAIQVVRSCIDEQSIDENEVQDTANLLRKTLILLYKYNESS